MLSSTQKVRKKLYAEKIMDGCSLDLRLSPMTSFRRDSTDKLSAIRSKEINAFYNARLREYDLVEIQIRAIIEMARKEREVTAVELTPVRLESPFEFSVKRSVKRFLEKRKKRNKSVTPHTSSSSSSSSSHNF